MSWTPLTPDQLSVAMIEEPFRVIVGRHHVRPATEGDAIAGVGAHLIVEPANEPEICSVLRCANQAGLSVIPRGGGTKKGWGNPPRSALIVLSMARLNGVLEHAWQDLTVTVEAGCTVSHMQQTLAKHGQRLAADPLWPERATIGGMLAANDTGALRLAFGGLRDLIIGVTVALPDGTLASSGGKVVKNVAGYDLPKLITGALGTLGVITSATFRLHPLPRNSRTLTFEPADLDQMQCVILAMQGSKLAHTSLQARLCNDARPRVDVLIEGTEAGIAAQEAAIRELAQPTEVNEGQPVAWAARQELWNTSGAVVKFSVLPSGIAKLARGIDRVSAESKLTWNIVVQGNGLGWLRMDGPADKLTGTLHVLRASLERMGGSFVIARKPPGTETIDTWGRTGDALPLMRALKQQFDPKGILNPRRFVGDL
jgi:glycolate oxidase FAD binding subunit